MSFFLNSYRFTGGFDFSTNLSAYWKLATNSLDSSGNGNNGIDAGMTYLGGYAKFGSGYIDIPDTDDLSFTDGVNDLPAHFLLGFIWNNKTGIQFWINKRQAADNREWQVFSDGINLQLFFQTPTSSPNANIAISIPVASISTGVLNTIQFGYEGNKLNTGITAYLNGNNPIGITSTTGTYTGQVNGTSIVRLGTNAWANDFNFNGDGKEWAVWKNRIMTGDEIQELHDRVIAGTPLI